MHLKKRPVLGILFALALQTQAIDFMATNAFYTATNQVVEAEQWVISSEMINLNGEHKNDLFLMAGGAVILNGTYDGNIWAMGGQSASLTGHCDRNVRFAGKSIQINGGIAANFMAMAETVFLGSNSVVTGDALIAGNNIIQEGLIGGNVSITSGHSVYLGGTIAGDVNVTAPEILFSKNARIDGDFTYTARQEIIPPEGVVYGNFTRLEPQAQSPFSLKRLYLRLIWFLAAILAGIPFITFFPMTTAIASQLIKRSPWRCLWVGFIASGLLPMLGLICFSSLIGVPLGLLLLTGWGTMLYLSQIIVGLVLGTLILRTIGTSIHRVLLALVAGLAVLSIASIFPSIGMPLNTVVLWIGMGSFMLAQLEKRRLIIQLPNDLKKLEALREKNNTEEETL